MNNIKNDKKRRYWNISEDTTNKIVKLYAEYKNKMNMEKLGYGEFITIAIDNLIYDLKKETFEDLKNKLS